MAALVREKLKPLPASLCNATQTPDLGRKRAQFDLQEAFFAFRASFEGFFWHTFSYNPYPLMLPRPASK